MAELVSIGAIAAELGLSPSYIRLLTDQGLFEAHRTAGGHRRYDLAATRQAWLAHCLERGGRPSGAAGEAAGRPAPTVERTYPLAGLEEDNVAVLPRPEPERRLDGATVLDLQRPHHRPTRAERLGERHRQREALLLLAGLALAPAPVAAAADDGGQEHERGQPSHPSTVPLAPRYHPPCGGTAGRKRRI